MRIELESFRMSRKSDAAAECLMGGIDDGEPAITVGDDGDLVAGIDADIVGILAERNAAPA